MEGAHYPVEQGGTQGAGQEKAGVDEETGVDLKEIGRSEFGIALLTGEAREGTEEGEHSKSGEGYSEAEQVEETDLEDKATSGVEEAIEHERQEEISCEKESEEGEDALESGKVEEDGGEGKAGGQGELEEEEESFGSRPKLQVRLSLRVSEPGEVVEKPLEEELESSQEEQGMLLAVLEAELGVQGGRDEDEGEGTEQGEVGSHSQGKEVPREGEYENNETAGVDPEGKLRSRHGSLRVEGDAEEEAFAEEGEVVGEVGVGQQEESAAQEKPPLPVVGRCRADVSDGVPLLLVVEQGEHPHEQEHSKRQSRDAAGDEDRANHYLVGVSREEPQEEENEEGRHQRLLPLEGAFL